MNMAETLRFQKLRGELGATSRWRATSAGAPAAGPTASTRRRTCTTWAHSCASCRDDEPLLFVGLGSNLLVRDGGWRGTAILMHAASRRPELRDGRIYAEAGVAGPKVARFAAMHDLEGAEFLAGVPGTVGGALAMNAGCYGGETWDVVDHVATIDRARQAGACAGATNSTSATATARRRRREKNGSPRRGSVSSRATARPRAPS